MRPEVQATPRFEYSVENPPPLEVLGSKVFAVHATPIMPKDGVIKAGAQDMSGSPGKWDDEPPSFRPTIHFALGELVRKHGQSSWEDTPYAIVTPLSALEPQLVNVFPHDTFVLGDYKLTTDATLLVPRGTNTSQLPSYVRVLEYGSGINLRDVVDQVIKDENGWQIRMEEEGVYIGSVAHIGDVEINSADFFKTLFDKHPHASFGTHRNPERGGAYRFGVIEETLEMLMKTYSDHWLRFGTSQVKFHRGLIVHNLTRLDDDLKASGLVPEALQAFEDKKVKLAGWLNIIDADLDARERLGVTLAGASENIQRQVRRQRNDPEKLGEIIESLQLSLQPVPEDEPISPSLLGVMLNAMSPQELQEFMSQNPDAFELTDLSRFYASYAVDRWIVIKSDRAREEGLDRIVEDAIPKFAPTQRKERESDLFKSLEDYLTVENNRLEAALDMLRLPTVAAYLRDQFGFSIPERGLQTLEDVIRAHPKTRIIFEDRGLHLDEQQQEAYRLLSAIGQGFTPRYDQQEALTHFRKASSLVFNLIWSQDSLQRDLETIVRPMNTIRDLDDIRIGDLLTLYEQFRRDYKSAADIWKKVGLAKEFRRRFPNDNQFWESPQSLVEIHKLLEADKTPPQN